MLGAPAQEIALLPCVSVAVGVVAAAVGPRDEIVVPEDEFHSLLLPLVVAAEARGATIRRVPFTDIANAVTRSTTIVATSHVRSNGGGVQDLDQVAVAAREAGAMVVVDATHAEVAFDARIRQGGRTKGCQTHPRCGQAKRLTHVPGFE